MSTIPTVKKTLSGWGRHPVVESRLVRPEKHAALRTLVRERSAGSLLARGSGRSYGDAALNGDGLTVLTGRLNRMLDFDAETGRLRCEAGVTLAEILEVFVPRGWFLPVTPGTKHVTVGGAVASDIHGKNHHRDGSFSNFVERLELLTASGDRVTCSPGENAALFRATVGGMGLTGIITEVTFRLQSIDSAYLHLHRFKARDLDDALALFDEHEPRYPYAVAWLDALAPSEALGRSLLLFGKHAAPSDLRSYYQRTRPFEVSSRLRLNVPFDAPSGLLNARTARLFNKGYYARQLSREYHAVVDYDRFFYPLDAIADWNRIYGRRGFVQYQCVVPPDGGREALIALLDTCRAQERGSFLAVLKRFGPEDPGYLSFPMSGYTLALDFPATPDVADFTRQLDEIVLARGGRVYLTKDAHLSAEAFRRMYPAYDEWKAVKAEVDPDNVFASEMARRLNLSAT